MPSGQFKLGCYASHGGWLPLLGGTTAIDFKSTDNRKFNPASAPQPWEFRSKSGLASDQMLAAPRQIYRLVY